MTSYLEVELVEDTPNFMGTDLELYEDLNKGDVLKVPTWNARVLIDRGNAEINKLEVEILEDIKEFVDVNLEKHKDLEKGDTLEIPKENATKLVKKGKARLKKSEKLELEVKI